MNIKKGDIVGRKSYGKDIYFIVNQILTTTRNHKFAILKGLNIRIEADSPIEDLEIIGKDEIISSIKKYDSFLEERKKGLFLNIFDFVKRVKVNKNILESLIS